MSKIIAVEDFWLRELAIGVDVKLSIAGTYTSLNGSNANHTKILPRFPT